MIVQRASAVLAACALAAACARGVEPVPLDAANTACAFCRMAVSDVRFAAQIAARGTEPVFFDDIGCLRDYLARPGVQLPGDAVAFVADHRTGEWVRAADAAYTRAVRIETPMRGGIIAHRDAASRRADIDTAAGSTVSAAEIFGAAGPPNGEGR